MEDGEVEIRPPATCPRCKKQFLSYTVNCPNCRKKISENQSDCRRRTQQRCPICRKPRLDSGGCACWAYPSSELLSLLQEASTRFGGCCDCGISDPEVLQIVNESTLRPLRRLRELRTAALRKSRGRILLCANCCMRRQRIDGDT